MIVHNWMKVEPRPTKGGAPGVLFTVWDGPGHQSLRVAVQGEDLQRLIGYLAMRLRDPLLPDDDEVVPGECRPGGTD